MLNQVLLHLEPSLIVTQTRACRGGHGSGPQYWNVKMPTSCMDFLRQEHSGAPPSVLAVFGTEEFLSRQTLLAVRCWIVGPEPDDFTYSAYAGSTARLADVLDDLHTRPFLGDRRLVVVEEGEDFVAEHREALLRFVESPSDCGVLVLQTKTWRSNLKLTKAVETKGLAIEANAPKAWHVPGWCVHWCQMRYAKKIGKPAAEWLVELVGTSLGLLDQELSKLAGYVGDRPEIDIQAVNRVVAGTRTESTFKLLDLVLGGQLAKAMEMLDRQLVAGDAPVMIVAMLGSQLRKLTRAARLVVAGQAMNEALREAGVPPFAIDKSAQQLRFLGRARMAEMYRLVLQTDLRLKGGSALSPRAVLERFLVELVQGASGAPARRR